MMSTTTLNSTTTSQEFSVRTSCSYVFSRMASSFKRDTFPCFKCHTLAQFQPSKSKQGEASLSAQLFDTDAELWSVKLHRNLHRARRMHIREQVSSSREAIVCAPRKNFSARIFRENRKSCFSAGSGFFTYRSKFSALLNLRRPFWISAQTKLVQPNIRPPRCLLTLNLIHIPFPISLGPSTTS